MGHLKGQTQSAPTSIRNRVGHNHMRHCDTQLSWDSTLEAHQQALTGGAGIIYEDPEYVLDLDIGGRRIFEILHELFVSENRVQILKNHPQSWNLKDAPLDCFTNL